MTIFSGAKKRNSQGGQKPLPSSSLAPYEGMRISGKLDDTIGLLNRILGECDDLSMRRFHVFGQFPAAMIYFSNLVDMTIMNDAILKPLMYTPPHISGNNIETSQLIDILLKDTLYHSECKTENYLTAIVLAILQGETVVLVDGMDQSILIGTRNIKKRAIDQPMTEQVIRGSREGFIELMETNIALLRYRLPTPEFRVNTMEIGRRSMSKVAICFIDGIVNPELVQEVKKRLSKIDIDAVLDSGYLEQYIQDNHFSPFPQVQYTERPDKVVANILEGRVAIFVDGSPLALIVPTVFAQFYQTMEDYTERFLLMSAIRLARLIALVFSLVFPSLYIAIISFNPELIPTDFAVAVAGGRSGVPFPAIVEVLVIEISMEVLREATLRLPQQVGGALSIVGVLVIGQAAVAAGFASPITVVIIALTTIGSFATPAYNAALALRLLRFPLMILAGLFGLYGIMIGLILIANHLLSLKSFGVPYLSPLVPGNFNGMKDLFIRSPMWWMKKRPAFLQPLDSTRTTGKLPNDDNGNVLDPIKMINQQGGKGDGGAS